MLVVAHPVVDQTRYTESLLQTSRHWLGTDCESHVVIDGYEKRATLSLAELEKSMGRETSLRLPMEWLSRLDSINAGVPLSALPRSSTYQKKLAEFVKKYYVGSRPVTDSLGLFKKRRVAQE
jgi:pilus assembly protein CpaE